MFGFTHQERQVILFLSAMALLGLGINFGLKINPRLEKVIKVDKEITKLDINEVGPEDLLHLEGLRANLAKKIIAYRNSHGRFKDLEELKEIKGIGDYRYERLKELFYIKEE